MALLVVIDDAVFFLLFFFFIVRLMNSELRLEPQSHAVWEHRYALQLRDAAAEPEVFAQEQCLHRLRDLYICDRLTDAAVQSVAVEHIYVRGAIYVEFSRGTHTPRIEHRGLRARPDHMTFP